MLAQQELRLVKVLPTQPSRDLAVRLAGVAGSTGGHHVCHRVAAAPRQRQDTVALQRSGIDCAAVRAPTPGLRQRRPLRVGQVVPSALQAPLSAAGPPGSAAACDDHGRKCRRVAGRGMTGNRYDLVR